MNKKIIKPSYETVSYLFVGETIKLNINFETNKWESLDENIATVCDGIVKGINEGFCGIRCTLEDGQIFDYYVTVLNKKKEEVISDLLEAHNSNIFMKKDFRIGYFKEGYDTNIIESVSKLLFNDPLVINNDYLEAGNKKWETNESREYMKSIEFITVHYTANFRPGANALAHANYFTSDTHNTSIHYNTGNDGVYLSWDNKKRAAHAGDSAGPIFEWVDTGVDYDACELDQISVTVSNDFYYEINGIKSLIPLPKPYTYNERKTNHKYLNNGLIQLEDTDIVKQPEEMFNKMGFAFIVKENKYFMSTTWWCYTQTSEGRICNVGGNRNSIGIESCVNEGSDLWYTWQKTAQLVAKLMVDNNLDIKRVKGHHFFTAKNCPQPMLENNLEIWYKFIELVEMEYLFITKYNNYDISFNLVKGDNVNNNGRINSVDTQSIIYEIIIKNKETKKEEKIVLSSIVCS